MIERIADRGAVSVLETNGSWAVNREKTLKKLRELQDRGLDCLALSIDQYHLEYGTLDRSLALVEAARELDLPCRVIVVASPDEQCDLTITDALDERSIPFFYEEVMTLGRGEDLGDHAELLQHERCDSVGITVLPDGDVVSCVGAYNGHRTLSELPLYAGNTAKNDGHDLFEREMCNPIARAIDEKGHEYLLEQLPPHLLEQVQSRESCESLCGYCHKMLRNRDIVEHLRSALPSPEPVRRPA